LILNSIDLGFHVCGNKLIITTVPQPLERPVEYEPDGCRGPIDYHRYGSRHSSDEEAHGDGCYSASACNRLGMGLVVQQLDGLQDLVASVAAEVHRQEECVRFNVDRLLDRFAKDLRNDRFDDAERDAHKVLELDPENQTAKQALAIVQKLKPARRP
jgi:hypothetical protein